MIKKIFKGIYFLLVAAIIFVVLGFAIEANKTKLCNSFTVNVDHSCGSFFIDSEQIVNMVYEMFDTVYGVPLNQIRLSKIENFITEMTFVKDANVYKTISGEIKADITQRIPLARIINKNGTGFYIDTDGKLMPLSNDYTARVMIFTGGVNISYNDLIDLSGLFYNDYYDEENIQLLKDIYIVASHINSHQFFKVFIDYIYFSSDGRFELIPKNGSHIVELGTTERIEQKFQKLAAFYKYGLINIGWNSYNRINLEYKNQVICAK